ncbi:MAG: class I SAM-dependent methyltransferase [Candidatus Heimdallarchaeota archaeon]
MVNEIDIKIEELRKNFLQYTRKAFEMLPRIDYPHILDVGCGSGIPAIELAQLSNAEIIGIDIDQEALEKFNEKIKKFNLSDRVKTINCSLLDIDFPNENFDIIWAEGVMQFIGFEKALKEWNRMLKKNGFIVVHDDLRDKEKKLKTIPKYGYKLVDYFLLPDDVWWRDYFMPLELQIEKFSNFPRKLKKLKSFIKEINSYKKNPGNYRSMFYLIQKVDRV